MTRSSGRPLFLLVLHRCMHPDLLVSPSTRSSHRSSTRRPITILGCPLWVSLVTGTSPRNRPGPRSLLYVGNRPWRMTVTLSSWLQDRKGKGTENPRSATKGTRDGRYSGNRSVRPFLHFRPPTRSLVGGSTRRGTRKPVLLESQRIV